MYIFFSSLYFGGQLGFVFDDLHPLTRHIKTLLESGVDVLAIQSGPLAIVPLKLCEMMRCDEIDFS